MFQKLSHTFKPGTSSGTHLTSTKTDSNATPTTKFNKFIERKPKSSLHQQTSKTLTPSNPVEPIRTTVVTHEQTLDLNTFLENKSNRDSFRSYLRGLQNGKDKLLLFYMLITSFENQKKNAETIKTFIDRGYEFYKENKIDAMLSKEIARKLEATLSKSTYFEEVFKDARGEIKGDLEPFYMSYLDSTAATTKTFNFNTNPVQLTQQTG